jgi:tRNA A58 N-methylase Trm61
MAEELLRPTSPLGDIITDLPHPDEAVDEGWTPVNHKNPRTHYLPLASPVNKIARRLCHPGARKSECF